MHSDAEGHEIPLSGLAVTAATDQRAVGVPGVVVVSTLPIRSTAAQNEADGHEIPVSPLRPSELPSMSDVVHVDGPPVGFDELTRSPPPSTARHRPALGHEMAVNDAGPEGSIWTGASQLIRSARAVAAMTARAATTTASASATWAIISERRGRAAACSSMTGANVPALRPPFAGS